jgi:hypothetical protein
MQVRKGSRRSSRTIGVRCAAIASVLALAVSGVSPASAETHEGGTGNMVFFKGGFMNLNQDRGGQIFTDTGSLTGTNGGNTGWYAGAGLDLVMSKDVWGAMSKTWVVGEIGLQLNRISSNRVNNTAGSVASNTLTGTTALDPQKVQLTMLTIDVAPKIKFMEDSAFRPWIIPIGLDFHVISPPSNRTQYLDMGVQFGAGFEWAVWKAFKLGLDARYHVTSRMTNTNNDYFQVGPYAGISF